MTRQFVDFDKARAERRREPVVLRAYGHTFELPSTIPAAFMLDVIDLQATHDSGSEVTTSEAIGLMRRILPRDVLETLLQEPDFSGEDMIDLFTLVIDAYKASDSSDSGEAQSPMTQAGRKRSSSSGA